MRGRAARFPRGWFSWSSRAGWSAVPLLALIFANEVAATTDSWNNFTGTNEWSVNANWLEGSHPPADDPALGLRFVDAGTSPYVSHNDLDAMYVRDITLNRPSAVAASITGNPFGFLAAAEFNATITQSGSGAFAISNDLNLVSNLVAGGQGSGVTSLTGLVSGDGALQVTAGHWLLSNPGSTWTGGTTITGGVLELSPGPDAALNLPAVTDSPLGTDGPLTIDGGELRLTASGSGRIQASLNSTRPIAFGPNGGTLKLDGQVQPNLASVFAVALPKAPATLGKTAVIQFNGGAQGTSNGGTADWNADSNALRVTTWTNLDANNPVRLELTNGALLSLGTAYDSFTSPLTLRGVIGGDPSANSPALNVGRVLVDRAVKTSFTFVNGLAIEGVMQIASARGPRQIVGNITVRDGGVAVFAGRASGSTLISSANSSHLELGTTVNAQTITVQSGGTLVTDLRIRTEQSNEFGVRVNNAMVLQAGGTVRTTQSWMSPVPGGTDKPVGWQEFFGDLTAQGSSAAEAVFDLRLGAANVAGPFTNENGVSFGTHVAGGALDSAALDIIVNGSGFGGLRVQASGRITKSSDTPTGTPAYLFGADGALDPMSNAAKLANLLTSPRLAALRGSGGYLTPAAQGAVFTFPLGGEWPATFAVGLQAIDSNGSGIDLAFDDGLTSWRHNLAVGNRATIDLGALPFTLLAGSLSGKGTVAGTGGFTIGAGAGIAPGLDGVDQIGTLSTNALTLSNGAHFIFDLATPAASDEVVAGALTLDAQQFSDFDFHPLDGFGPGTYPLFSSSGLAGGLGANITGVVGGYDSTLGISENELRLIVVPEPGARLSLLGAAGLILGGRRRRVPVLRRSDVLP